MIYVQRHPEYNLPNEHDACCAMWGAINCGVDYRLVSYEDVISGLKDNFIKRNLFVGSVEFMREVFKRVGLDDVRLPFNSNREHEIKTLGEVREITMNNDISFFIKPLEIKLFTGFVIDKMQNNSIRNIPDDTLVMVYEPFKHRIVSEWRVYVNCGNIDGVYNYSGDFFKTVDKQWIYSVISELKYKMPISYVTDVGVLENGENVIIEFNDMWAIGNYGLENDTYFKMLKKRYFEIIRSRT